MDDLIRRLAAIEVIDAVFPVDPMKSEYAQGIACGAALAKTYVEQLPSAQQWIPCSEMLPMDKGVYLVTDDSGRVAWVEKAWFMWCDDGSPFWEYANVTAWMPLPGPYEDKHED